MGGQGVDLAPQTLRNVGEQCISTCYHNVFEEVTSDSFVALHDRVVDVFLDTLLGDVFSARQLRLEENLRSTETLLAYDDFASIR